jgi:hypothetical protein
VMDDDDILQHLPLGECVQEEQVGEAGSDSTTSVSDDEGLC